MTRLAAKDGAKPVIAALLALALAPLGSPVATASVPESQTLTVSGVVRTGVMEQEPGTLVLADVEGVLLPVPESAIAALTDQQPVTVTLEASSEMTAMDAVRSAGLGLPGATVVGVESAGEAPTPVPPQTPTGPQTLTLLPVHWGSAAPADTLVAAARGGADVWEVESAGALTFDVDVATSVAVPDPNTCDAARLLNIAMAAHGRAGPPADGDHVIVVVPADPDCLYLPPDAAVIDGGVAVISDATSANIADVIGYHFGLGPAVGLFCEVGGRAVTLGGECEYSWPGMYGNTSGSPFHPGLASALGWHHYTEASATESMVVDLAPFSVARQAIRVPMTGGRYLFMRYPGYVGARIDILEPGPPPRVARLDAQPVRGWSGALMDPGDALALPGGYTIAVLSRSAESLRVSVTPPGLDLTPPTAPVVDPIASGWLSWRSAPISWRPSEDAGTGLAGYRILVDGIQEVVVPADRTSANAAYWYQYRRWADGPHVLVVEAVDRAGNRTSSAPIAFMAGLPPEYLSGDAYPGASSVLVQWSGRPYPRYSYFDVTLGGWVNDVWVDVAAIRVPADGVVQQHRFQAAQPGQYLWKVCGTSPLGSRCSDGVLDVVPTPSAELVITSPAQGSTLGTSTVVTWQVRGATAEHATGYAVSVDWGDPVIVDATTRSTALELSHGHHEITVTALESWQATGRWSVGVDVPWFSDVPQGQPFRTEITWLADSGITTGYPDGTFRPGGAISRDAMAAFLFRMAGPAAADYVAPTTSRFSDVPVEHPFYREISWLADEGISTGYSDGTYRPGAPVNRDAMAAFLYRYANGDAAYEPETAEPFSDVGPDHPFYAQIAWMNDAGISTGYADGTYRPSRSIARDAMAAFLYRMAHRLTSAVTGAV